MQQGAEPRAPRIAVCGASVADAATEELALRVGAALGKAGAVVLCGGLGGVMQAVARGARTHGALTVGVLPGTSAATANSDIVLPLPTGMGEARNALIVRFAQAVIAIGGEWGTLSEIALARRTGVPVVLLAPTLARDLGIDVAPDPEAAVDRALQLATGA